MLLLTCPNALFPCLQLEIDETCVPCMTPAPVAEGGTCKEYKWGEFECECERCTTYMPDWCDGATPF